MKTTKNKKVKKEVVKSDHIVYDKDQTPILVYKLAKAGLGDRKISEAMGISYKTFYLWKNNKGAIKYALVEARKKDPEQSQTFLEYIHNRLPEHLREVWDEIVGCENSKPTKKLTAMLEESGRRGRQHLFLHALFHYNYNLSEACRSVNIAKSTFEYWISKDPDFSDLIEEMDWHKKNFFEGSLIQLVKSGDPTAIRFVNQTYNSDRGYGVTKKIEKNVSISGSIDLVPIEELGLSFEERKKMLDAVRQRKSIPEKRIEVLS